MWCFKSEDRCVYILPNCKKTFGKSLGEVKLENDETVSRLHATIFVESSKKSDAQYECFISDISKYGTFLLRDEVKRKLPINEKVALKVHDKVQFGLKHTIFTVTQRNFVTAGSNLSKEEVEKLGNIMKNLGGTLCESWQNSCTHLTMPERVVFTTKLAYALISAKPVVTVAYWEAMVKAITKSRELPKFDDFLPVMKEEGLQARSELFMPKEERKMLFHGLSFVHFCAKQYFTCASLIKMAGGKSCVYPTKKPLTPRDLTAKNAIVIQQPANDSSQLTQVIATDYPIIYHKLNALKRRMIADTEIPLAILYCSTEKYCNPTFNFGTLLKSTTQIFSPSDLVIVEDTQDVPMSNKKKSTDKEQQRQQIIPESCDQLYNNQTWGKACFSNENKNSSISESSRNKSDIIGNNNVFREERCKKQFRIIPETLDSFEKNVANDLSTGNSRKPQIILQSCERNIVNEQEGNISPENIEFKQQENTSMKKNDNFVVEKNNPMSEDNKPISKRNNLTLENECLFLKDNLKLVKNIYNKDNSILKKRNLTDQDNINENHNWNNTKGPRIVSIEKIDCGDNRKKNQEETEKRKKIKVEEKDQKEKKRPRKTTDWYEEYVGREMTNEILRKDAPRGKTFVKAPVLFPIKKLTTNDFSHVIRQQKNPTHDV